MRNSKMLAIVVLALALMVWPVSTVLGVVSLTVNGQPLDSIILEVGQSCTVEVVSDDSSSYTDHVGFDNGVVLGDFSHRETTRDAGDLAEVKEYNEPTFYGYRVMADGSLLSPPRPGVHFVFEYESQEAGETDVKLYYSKFISVIDSVHITVIPKPMGMAWTYQGQLLDANSTADGLYDFQFKLYHAPNGGIQEGNTIDINDLDVIDGYFTVELDFGSDAFDGNAVWLEIGVRPGDSTDSFTTLSQRQEVTPTPYAIYAETAGTVTGGLSSSGTTNYIAKFIDPNNIGDSEIYESAGKVGIGTTSPEAKLSIQMPRGFLRPSTVGGLVIKHDLLNSANQLEVQDPSGNIRFVADNIGNVGIGATSRGEKLHVEGNVRVTGNLIVEGDISGSIHFSQITGLLGTGYSMVFPYIIDNLTTIEIHGIETPDPVVIVHGPGYDIERIEGYDDQGRHYDQPGLSMEHPLIFECSGTGADNVQAYFDAYFADPINVPPKVGSIIIFDLSSTEVFRWNFFEFIPQTSEPGGDGRTRFTMVNRFIPNTNVHWQQGEPTDAFGNQLSNNPLTDTLVEISGVIAFYPEVEVDDPNRTLTLTYDFVEGHGIWDWVIFTIEGIGEKRDLSVIQEEGGVEVSRRNYFRCFPIKYEQLTGFGLDIKVKARVVLSFDMWEDSPE